MYRQLLLYCVMGMAMRAQGGDLKLTTATHTILMAGHTQDFEQTLIIHDQRSRGLSMRFTSSAGAAQSPTGNVAIIQQCDARQQLLVDFDNRVYSVHPLPGAMSKAQMDAALARAKANPLPTPTETLTIATQVTDLNERKMAFGRVMRHYKIHSSRVASPGANTQSSEEDTDGWFVEIPEYDQLSGCYSFGGRKTKSGAFVTASNGPMNYRIVSESRGPLVVGYPAEVTRTMTSSVRMPDKTEKTYTTTTTQKITELSTAPLDPALFDLPPGFAKVAEVEMRPTPSWSYRAQVAWAKFIDMFSY